MSRPIYKNKKFKNEEEFEVWLKKTATRKIVFEDDGQDFLIWYIDDRGEVLHSAPFQAWLWNGKMVDVDEIKVGYPLPLQDGQSIKHRVLDVVKLTGGSSR